MSSNTVRDLFPHRYKCQSLEANVIKNCLQMPHQCASTNDYFSYLPSQEQLKQFNNRLVACNGDCGSKLSKIIDCCAHNKEISSLKGIDNTIENAFWCYGSPLRRILIKLIARHKPHSKNKMQFCQDMYTKLNDQNCFIQGSKWSKKMISLFVTLSVDHMNILRYLANYSCKMSNRTLLQEIDAHFNKNIDELQHKIAIINDMRMDEKYNDIVVEALFNQQIEMITQLKEMKKQQINKSDLKSKIRKIKQTWQYRQMQSKNMALSNLEILSIILYCDYNIFVNKMRQSQREQHLNSCEWRTLFYHLHSAIDKMHKALHYKNKWFYQDYIRNKPSYTNKIFRGIYNRSLDNIQNGQLSLQTITSFSAEFDIAKTFASPRGSIISINDAFKYMFNGNLRAADVSWISTWKGEEEFVVLPVTFKSMIKIEKHDKNYYECIYDAAAIQIYEANILQFKCDIAVCKHLHRLVLGLYWFSRKHKISSTDNMLVQCVKGKKYLSYHDLNHVAKVHYNELTNYCTAEKSGMIVANMTKYGIKTSRLELILEHIVASLKTLDMKQAQETEMKHLDTEQDETVSLPAVEADVKVPVPSPVLKCDIKDEEFDIETLPNLPTDDEEGFSCERCSGRGCDLYICQHADCISIPRLICDLCGDRMHRHKSHSFNDSNGYGKHIGKVIVAGSLLKKSRYLGVYRNRYMVLLPDKLISFKGIAMKSITEIFDLWEWYNVSESNDTFCFKIQSAKSKVVFKASDSEEKMAWMKSLSDAMLQLVVRKELKRQNTVQRQNLVLNGSFWRLNRVEITQHS